MDKSSKERRKYLRIYRNFILTYHEKDRSTPVHKISQVNNISRGGLNFSSTYPLKQGVVVVVDLRTPFISDSLELEGIVLECKEKISEMIYEVRIQFQNIPVQALSVLEKVENYGKDKEGH